MQARGCDNMRVSAGGSRRNRVYESLRVLLVQCTTLCWCQVCASSQRLMWRGEEPQSSILKSVQGSVLRAFPIMLASSTFARRNHLFSSETQTEFRKAMWVISPDRDFKGGNISSSSMSWACCTLKHSQVSIRQTSAFTELLATRFCTEQRCMTCQPCILSVPMQGTVVCLRPVTRIKQRIANIAYDLTHSGVDRQRPETSLPGVPAHVGPQATSRQTSVHVKSLLIERRVLSATPVNQNHAHAREIPLESRRQILASHWIKSL
jgi:hypothetical protein